MIPHRFASLKMQVIHSRRMSALREIIYYANSLFNTHLDFPSGILQNFEHTAAHIKIALWQNLPLYASTFVKIQCSKEHSQVIYTTQAQIKDVRLRGKA